MPETTRVLIIDDEPDLCELITMTLTKMNCISHSAFSFRQATDILEKESFDLCLTDMQLPDGNGLDLIKHLQKKFPNTAVAVITAHGNMDSAITALKYGAFDFVSKPIDIQILRNLVNTASKLNAVEKPISHENNQLIGNSPCMRQVQALIQKVSRSQAPVYISGESGVGKELVARLIHQYSPRSSGPFIPVNCGAIVPQLMESELFGYTKGSFTGATSSKTGLFQAAHQGTLFLDEIAEIPLDMQVKLLRAIQEKAIRPVGSNQETFVDVRILSATHHPLMSLVQTGKFRQDLYYRLNVIELQVPALRERMEDLPSLVSHFLDRLSKVNHEVKPSLSKEAYQALQDYSFPGNVRELENILERAMALKSGTIIQSNDLQLPIAHSTALKNTIHVSNALEQKEKQIIMDALVQNQWNITQAAKFLGITFRTLRYRMKKYHIEKPEN
jgi:two-component system response regulator PilR (NtrC family)